MEINEQAKNKHLDIQTIKNECLVSLQNLFDTYNNNEFAISKLHKFYTLDIKNMIEQSIQNESTRNERMNDIRDKSESFMLSFMDSYPQYFYFHNNIFVSYDGNNYELCGEDHISNRIIMMLSIDPVLSIRKHKIKSIIIKRLKDRGTNIAVPSSHIIQNVIRPLYPSIFETRNEVKYFLTIIGDALMKKQTDNVYFIHYRAKEFIDYLISGLTYFKPTCGSTLSNIFKYKFQNHSLENSRVLRVQGSGDSLYYPNMNIINTFFVSQYYSNRYGSAENMLNQISSSNSYSLASMVKILGTIGSEQGLINWFVEEAFIPSKNDTLTSKTIQFMWKRFCNKKKIPNAIQNSCVIPLVINCPKLINAFDKERGLLIGYSGNQLFNPSIDIFIRFWEETITCSMPTEMNYEFKQLEIDELSTLFTSWERKNISKNQRYSIPNLDEDAILSCIKHFYPNVKIEHEKFLNGVTCSLWDKQTEVTEFINDYLINHQDVTSCTPVETIYRAYREHMLRTNLSIANKEYFERIYNHFM